MDYLKSLNLNKRIKMLLSANKMIIIYDEQMRKRKNKATKIVNYNKVK